MARNQDPARVDLQWFGEDNPNPEEKPQAEAGSAAAGTGSSEAPSWRDELPEPLKTSKSLAKFAKPADVAQSYVELEGKLGKSIAIPGKDAKPEEWEKFFSRIGRPQTADDYSLEPVDGFELDQAFMSRLKASLHAGGLTQAQAQRVFQFLGTETVTGQTAQREARAQKFNEGKTALQRDWGPRYEEKLEYAKRYVQQNGGDAAARHLEELGVDNDPVILSLLSRAGEATGAHKFVTGTSSKGKTDGAYGYMAAQLGKG